MWLPQNLIFLCLCSQSNFTAWAPLWYQRQFERLESYLSMPSIYNNYIDQQTHCHWSSLSWIDLCLLMVSSLFADYQLVCLLLTAVVFWLTSKNTTLPANCLSIYYSTVSSLWLYTSHVLDTWPGCGSTQAHSHRRLGHSFPDPLHHKSSNTQPELGMSCLSLRSPPSLHNPPLSDSLPFFRVHYLPVNKVPNRETAAWLTGRSETSRQIFSWCPATS